jgi:RHS repeat-associated protein
VKLEVPASAVGLEGRAVKGMAFTLYGGRVAWDKAGKRGTVPPPPPNPVMGRDGFDNLTYNTVNNQIISPGFEYAPDGSQTRAVIDNSGTAQQYRYDCANRLVQVLDGSGNVLATHAYGASSQRLMSVEGGVTKYFAWDGSKLSSEYEAWGTNALIWKTSYVYLGDRLLATTSGASGTETRFHHPGRQGTRLATDTNGTVVTEQFTMPFGNMLPFTSVYGGENPYQNPALANPSKKRFTSYVRSDVTTLDYAVNRFYSSQQGRFTQVDPIGMGAVSLSNPQTLNMYAYCGNDPGNCVDPDGLLFGWLSKVFKWVARVAAVVLAVAAVLAVSWGFGAGVAIKLGLGAFKFALDGWGNSKWTRLLSAGIGAYFGFKLGNLGSTPPTFPFAEGGGSPWRSWLFAAVGAVYSFIAQQRPAPKQKKSESSICSTLGDSGGTLPIRSDVGDTDLGLRLQFDGSGKLIGVGVQLTGENGYSSPGISIEPNTRAGVVQTSPGTVELGFSRPVLVGTGMAQAKIRAVTFSDGKFKEVIGSAAPTGVPLSDPNTKSSLLLDILNDESSTSKLTKRIGSLVTNSVTWLSRNVKCTDLFGR